MVAFPHTKTAAQEKSSHRDYFNIAISVDCVIFSYQDRDLKVLLIKSDLEEFSGLNSLLGDLVRPDEDLNAASCRVLKERTDLDEVFLQQVHTFGRVDRHPSGRVVTTAYYALININDHQLKLGSHKLHWHSVKSIKKLAFDHLEILNYCLSHLRNQLDKYPVVHHLLSEKFSLRELQEVYEAVLGTDLDRRNFRKKITLLDWLSDINEMETDVSHRPGKLYKFKSKFLKKR